MAGERSNCSAQLYVRVYCVPVCVSARAGPPPACPLVCEQMLLERHCGFQLLSRLICTKSPRPRPYPHAAAHPGGVR